jgi:hypothetical protein
MLTSLERNNYAKDVLPLKSHVLGDCVFIDNAEGVFTPVDIPSISCPIYKFQVKLTPKNHSVLQKEVQNALSIIGGNEVYTFIKPDNWDRMSFSQQDEIRFTDQYQKTGHIPVWNPSTNQYMVPRPIDNVLSSREYCLAHFHQITPPRLNGYTDGEPLEGLECTVEARLRLLDNGNLYLEAKAINIYCHN